jgi:uncharacterized protein
MRMPIFSFASAVIVFLFIVTFSVQAEKTPGDSETEMVIKSIVFDQNTQAPVVLLTDEKGNVVLPIWIGLCEARSIGIGISDAVAPRPMTYDLIAAIIRTLNAKVERIVIVDVRDQVYYAQVEVSVDGKISKIDARPSDAIALASRMSSPIYVKKSVLDKAALPDPQKEERGI